MPILWFDCKHRCHISSYGDLAAQDCVTRLQEDLVSLSPMAKRCEGVAPAGMECLLLALNGSQAGISWLAAL